MDDLAGMKMPTSLLTLELIYRAYYKPSKTSKQNYKLDRGLFGGDFLMNLAEKFEDFWRSTEWQAYERNRIQEAFYAGAVAVAEDYSIQNVKAEIAAFKKGSVR